MGAYEDNLKELHEIKIAFLNKIADLKDGRLIIITQDVVHHDDIIFGGLHLLLLINFKSTRTDNERTIADWISRKTSSITTEVTPKIKSISEYYDIRLTPHSRESVAKFGERYSIVSKKGNEMQIPIEDKVIKQILEDIMLEYKNRYGKHKKICRYNRNDFWEDFNRILCNVHLHFECKPFIEFWKEKIISDLKTYKLPTKIAKTYQFSDIHYGVKSTLELLHIDFNERDLMKFKNQWN